MHLPLLACRRSRITACRGDGAGERIRSLAVLKGIFMGYFANGFVFTTPPDFESATNAVPGRSARLQAQAAFYLVARPVEAAAKTAAWPFTIHRLRSRWVSHRSRPLWRGDAHILSALERLQQLMGFQSVGREASRVHLALAVAGATGCPAFFFAADDEETNMACNAAPGARVIRLPLRSAFRSILGGPRNRHST